MGDGELSTVDFDNLTKSMSFYSPEQSVKDFRASTKQQLDESIASQSSVDGSIAKQLYTSDLRESPKQMEKTVTPPTVDKQALTENGECRSDVQNGLHKLKESGAEVADVDALMSMMSLNQLGIGGVSSSTQPSNLWADQSLSAVYQILAQTSAAAGDGVQNLQHRPITAQHPLPLQQGNWFLNGSQAGQMAYSGSNSNVQGNWMRQNVVRSGSRPVAGYSVQPPSHMLTPGQAVPIDSSLLMSGYRNQYQMLQHFMNNKKQNGDSPNSDNGIGSHQVTFIIFVSVIELRNFPLLF